MLVSPVFLKNELKAIVSEFKNKYDEETYNHIFSNYITSNPNWDNELEIIEYTTIYIELKNEGTFVCRPVEAKKLKEDRYQIVSKNTDPEDEEWEFVTGDIVECQIKKLSDGKSVFLAVKKI